MPFVPVSQAASYLNISDDTLRRRAKSGKIDSSRDGLGRLLVEVPADNAALIELEGKRVVGVAAVAEDVEGADLRALRISLAAADARAATAERSSKHTQDLLEEVRIRAALLETELSVRRREGDELRVLLGQAQENVRGFLGSGAPAQPEPASEGEVSRRRWYRRG